MQTQELIQSLISSSMEADPENTYWCYACEKQFSASGQAEACLFCSSPAFQAIDASHQNSQPSAFQAYQIPSVTSQTPQRVNPQPAQRNIMFHPQFIQGMQLAPVFIQNLSLGPPQLNAHFVNTLNHIQQVLFQPGGGIANLINSLLGQPNLTPASTVEVSRLQKIDQVPECSICQEQNGRIENVEERKGVKLRCGHMFHHHCIGPWFERTNTCPSCRVRIE